MKKSDEKTSSIFMELMFIVVGLVVIGGAIIISLCNRRFYKTAEKTTGVITNIEVKGDDDYTAYVTYEVDGVQYDNIKLGYYDSGMSVGKTINIYYKKDNPGKIKTEEDTIFLGVIGGVFLIAGIIFANVFTTKNKKIKKTGVRYIADITNITINVSMMVNGRHPYIVECQVTDEITGAISLYRSGNIYEDISVYSLEKVSVYVDNNNPSKYYVDIDEAIERAKKQNIFGITDKVD